MDLYEVPVSMTLLDFAMGTMSANIYMHGIMLVLRAVFNMLVRNAVSRRYMHVCNCDMFSVVNV